MKQIPIFIITIVLFFSGCKNSSLEEPNESADNFFDNELNFNLMLYSCSDPLAWRNMYAMNLSYIWDVMGGDSEIAGNGPQDQESAQSLMLYRKNIASNEISSDIWDACYKGISRCNKVINEISVRIDDNHYSDKKNAQRIVAEAKFLKAFYYFELTKAFGPVILYRKTPDEEKLAEYTNRHNDTDDGSLQVAKQWAYIEELLLVTIPDLPAKIDMPDTELGRATKESAQALLAKKYVFNKEWDNAKTQVDAIIQGRSFDIETWKQVKYQDMFQVQEAGKNGYQSIFEVQLVSGHGDIQFEGYLRSRAQSVRIVNVDGEVKETTDWGINGPVKEYVELFDNAIHDIGDYDYDPRADLIAKPGDSIMFNGEWVPIAFNHPTFHITGFVNRKAEFSDVVQANSDNLLLSCPLIRFADVLLWKAEISAQLNDLSTALEYVNIVRERARLSKRVPDGNGWYTYVNDGTIPADYTSSDFSSQEKALELIYKERRLELGMEGHTFHDIVRTGRADVLFSNRGPLDSHGRQFTWTTGVNEVLPIFSTHSESYNDNVKQNKGYY